MTYAKKVLSALVPKPFIPVRQMMMGAQALSPSVPPAPVFSPQVALASDVGSEENTFTVLTHLGNTSGGRLVEAGDMLLGYDLRCVVMYHSILVRLLLSIPFGIRGGGGGGKGCGGNTTLWR